MDCGFDSRLAQINWRERMLHVVKKWEIQIAFNKNTEHPVIFQIYDDSYINMLRKLSEISFKIDPSNIAIIEVKQEQNQAGNQYIPQDMNVIINNPNIGFK